MPNLRQLRLFACWIPKKIGQQIAKLHGLLDELLSDDPSFWVLASLLVLLLGMLGSLLVFGVLLGFGILPEGTRPEMAMAIGTSFSGVYIVVMLTRRLYKSFLKEQEKLFDTLRKEDWK